MALLHLEASALVASLTSVANKRPSSRSSFIAGTPLRRSHGSPAVRSSGRRSVRMAAHSGAPVQTSIMHVVEPGDTLWSIARTYGTSYSELNSLNPSLKDGVKVGDTLIVGGAGEAARAATSVSSVVKVAAQEAVNHTSAPKGVSLSFESLLPLGLGLVGAAVYSKMTGKEAPQAASSMPAAPVAQPMFIPVPIPTYSGNGVASQLYQASEATPTAVAAIKRDFPNAMVDREFMRQVESVLGQLGFRGDNSIALISTCRDEITRPLVVLVDRIFGHSFNIAGLGGLISCGITGIKAGMAHSPQHPTRDSSGAIREKYVFFAFPHIAIDEQGRIGKMVREGRLKESSACLALIVARDEIEKPGTDSSYTENDLEYGLLRKKLLARKSCMCQQPSLVEVTNNFREILLEDLAGMIESAVDTKTADYAVITGVQIHSGCQLPNEGFRPERVVDYVAAGSCYAVVNGERFTINADGKTITAQKGGRPASKKVLSGKS